jgi:amidase
VGADPGRLRIALSTVPITGTPVHPDCLAAVQDAAGLCADLGHEVEEASPEINGALILWAFTVVWSTGAALSIDGNALLTGRTPSQDQFEPLTWALAQQGRSNSASVYLAAVTVLQGLGRSVAQFLTKYDLWLTPTLAEPPVPLGTLDSPADDPLRGFERAKQFTPYTPIASATGQPAMSVPLHWNADGLPIGVQFAGRFGDEATLFWLAAQLEEARPWAHRRPPVSA